VRDPNTAMPVPVVHNPHVEKMIALQAAPAIRQIKREQAIMANPLTSILGLDGKVSDDLLAQTFTDFQGRPQNDNVGKLLQELLDACTTDDDKKHVNQCMKEAMNSSGHFLAQEGANFMKAIANLAGYPKQDYANSLLDNRHMQSILDRIFAAPIATWVAAIGRGGHKDVDPMQMPGPLGLLIKARARQHIDSESIEALSRMAEEARCAPAVID
jgi:hypothetical protein